MAVGRRRVAQLLQQPDLPGGGGEQVPPPHHPGDPHGPVVRRHRQLIGVHPIRPAEDEVPAVGVQPLGLGAVVAVYKRHRLRRHRHPPGRLPAGGHPGRPIRRGEAAAAAVVHPGPVSGVGGGGRQQLPPGAEAGIDQPRLHQAVKGGLVNGSAVALGIHRVPRLPAFVPSPAPASADPPLAGGDRPACTGRGPGPPSAGPSRPPGCGRPARPAGRRRGSPGASARWGWGQSGPGWVCSQKFPLLVFFAPLYHGPGPVANGAFRLAFPGDLY